MKTIKVLVVDDSAFMRKWISDFLSEHPRLEVIGTARNGQEALEKIAVCRPDVVTLDVEMPVMDGLVTLRRIMEKHPLPVVMVSSTTKEGAENTVAAMQYGAVDFVAKPSGPISLDLYKVKDELIRKVLHASEANMRALAARRPKAALWRPPAKTVRAEKAIVAIGTSTGGPRALETVLTQLPPHLAAPVVIVQHMPKGFTKSLANRLDALSAITVKEAEDGEVLRNGTAYIAPGGVHLVVGEENGVLKARFDESLPRAGHRPAVDVLFESLAAIRRCRIVAVIMTGMGSDGTAGLKKLKEGGDVEAIAEARETAVVYGMPRAAIEAGVIDVIAPLDGIAAAIVQSIGE
ncbi:chemotaxis response regulator protein-glutamate methylesterase [Geobacillus subterraneus]|uniref:Protein-glutamate methylesterase/protein-glutamine glutaminase n=2 Tax=Geobacillus TaxID=129337 RepID=A0ABM6ACI2_9BACL|nr:MULTISPECIES: chemotaxis response regulator protein-glutamate methylesterase [Geobacillus]AMX84021.1 chemotaxis response regulator protein-glutamate methylesterase [Geobacillus subterraneus]KZS26814.1 chemotaxis response regulator protein-glutamate methylesterase [Geobacillus subterraneus]OXB88229.1 chemotaxis response regulator protein-glutamate methylesterase [Geobacillus uzenensis]WPZ19532.1 chemotaxis response regulator protein-glutamate methylesterase [Geobacillus subterraneus]